MVYISHIVAVSNPVVDIVSEKGIFAGKGAGEVKGIPVLPSDVG